MNGAEYKPSVKPGPGYLYSMSAALAGMTCISAGLGGALIGREGGDPSDTLDTYTFGTFIFMFALAFAMRLIFWAPAPATLRHAVRWAVTVIFTLCVPAALVAMTMAWGLPSTTKEAWLPTYFSVLGLLCQVGTLLWLTRYRRQGV